MDLFKTLKQFKSIEPDKSFRDRSRGLILGARARGAAGMSLWDIVMRNIESGASLALAGLLLFVILGGLSTWGQALSPAPLEALNTASLRAEAQAVDIQIELANLNYDASSAKIGGETTAPAASAQPQPEEKPQGDLSIEEALEFLSQ